MANAPLAFYQSQLSDCKIQIKIFKKRSLILSLLRLSVFLTTAAGIYFFAADGTAGLLIALVGAILFFAILTQYVKVKKVQNYWKKKAEILEDEIVCLNGNYSIFDGGDEFKDKLHLFSADIDVFGDASFFQYINRTTIKESKAELAKVIGSNNIEDISEKQNAVKELSELADWRLDFSTNSALVEQTVSHQVVFDWLSNYKPIIPSFVGVLGRIFTVLTILAIGLYAASVVSYAPLIIIFFTGIAVSLPFVSKINKTSTHLSELKSVFTHYSNLIQLLEQKEFSSKNCADQKMKIGSNDEASRAVSQLSKYLSALDQRNNILFAVFGNAFFLWDCVQINKIEKWIATHKNSVKNWFETLTWFEAQNSLANFHFNHPNFVFPELSSEANVQINAENLGHFFIDDSKRICNDFEIDSNGFAIITGSNMAGKSTFLRTVALAIVSANIGLPVCAKQFKYKPIKLITSMRNTDSLQDESSYFFAELVRLKTVVDAVDVEPYFIILDEILKGTNSKDKEEGSIKLMQRLSKTSAGGLIATHDLALCEIEKDLVNIKNQYFDAEIVDNELYFDYTLKEGICKNMNASFLLKKMEIVR